MKLIAMIPARMGSKRIPKKNIRYMIDKPLIAYPIELAKQSKAFGEIYVTTEDDDLGAYIQTLGATYHKRPTELSADSQTNRGFTLDFLENHECDFVVMINPTSPLLRLNTLNSFIAFIQKNQYDTVLSTLAVRAESFYRGRPINFSLEQKVNSQFLEPISETVWALTAWRRATFLEQAAVGSEPIFGGKVGYFDIPKDESCDLDTPEDWRIAEGVLLSRQSPLGERYYEL